jgi:polyhydroxyalkanoate synthase
MQCPDLKRKSGHGITFFVLFVNASPLQIISETADMSSTAPKQSNKKNEKSINDAAGEVAGLDPLVGASSKDITDAFRTTSRLVIRHPIIAAKHGLGLMGKWVDVGYGTSDYKPAKRDRRFADNSWKESALYNRLLQGYLALDESLGEWVDDLDLEEVDERRARFVLDILTDSISPTNVLLTNPTALRKARETRGASVTQGLSHALSDIRHNGGMPSQVDKSVFKVGENLAISKGSVVYRNEILELIQYQPTTAKVHQRPMLVVPPQINKFYVFDLTPEKSIFQFLLSQGIRLFAVSWKNPTAQNRDWGMAQYVEALADAVEAVQAITGQPSLNLMGACSGGVTASLLSAYLDAQGSKAINALTLFVCVLSADREDTDISLFASDAAVEQSRRGSRKKGVLEGAELAKVFNWMRPNDLIWNYVVNNYLLGNKPPAFDILYWNNDTTNLPAQLHSDFLDLVHGGELVNPDGLSLAGQAVNLRSVECDKYLVAGVTDHITPWHACYRSTQILSGNIRFILSHSGHIQAMVNPPGNPKSSFYINEDLPPSHTDWFEGAEQRSGTWWPDWAQWLHERSGRKINAPKQLGRKADYPPMEAAPGTYIFPETV